MGWVFLFVFSSVGGAFCGVLLRCRGVVLSGTLVGSEACPHRAAQSTAVARGVPHFCRRPGVFSAYFFCASLVGPRGGSARARRACTCMSVYGFLSSPFFFVRACVCVVLRVWVVGQRGGAMRMALYVSVSRQLRAVRSCPAPLRLYQKSFFFSQTNAPGCGRRHSYVCLCGKQWRAPTLLPLPPAQVKVEGRTSPGHLAAAITTTAPVFSLAPATDGRRRGQAGRQAPRPGRALTRRRARHTPAGARSGGPCRGARSDPAA